MAEATMTVEDLYKKVNELGTTLSEATKRADRSEAIIKLSPEDRATFDSLAVEKQDEFLAGDEAVRKAMTPADKKKGKMKDDSAVDGKPEPDADDEPVGKSAGEVELTKKLEDVQKQLDAYKIKVETAENIAKNERETRLKVEFEKKAETEYAALPGTPVIKGGVLQVIASKLTTEEAAEVHKLLAAGNEALKQLGVSKGSDASPNAEGGSDAWNQIETLAKAEVAKAGGEKKLSFAKATTQVCQANPKLYEQYLGSK